MRGGVWWPSRRTGGGALAALLVGCSSGWLAACRGRASDGGDPGGGVGSAPVTSASAAALPAVVIADRPFTATEDGRPYAFTSVLATSNGLHGVRLHFSDQAQDCARVLQPEHVERGTERIVEVDLAEALFPDGAKRVHVARVRTPTMPGGDDPSARARLSSFDATAGARIEGALAIRVEHSAVTGWPDAFVGEGTLSILGCGRVERAVAERPQPVELTVAGERISVKGAIIEPSGFRGGTWLTLSSAPIDCAERRPPADARITVNLDEPTSCDSITLSGNVFLQARTIGGRGLLECVVSRSAGGGYHVSATSTDGRPVVRIEGDVVPTECRAP